MFDRSGYFHVQHAHNCCDSFLKYFSHWKTHGQFAGLSSFRSGSGLDGRYRIHLSGWQNPESVGTRRHQDVGRAINGSWGRRAGTPRRSVRDKLLWINRLTGTVKMKITSWRIHNQNNLLFERPLEGLSLLYAVCCQRDESAKSGLKWPHGDFTNLAFW